MSEIKRPIKRVYSRRKTHRLGTQKQDAYDRLMPLCVIPTDAEGSLDYTWDDGKIHLDIGFGNGESIIHFAKANPDYNIIGAEPFHNGMAHMLLHYEREGLDLNRLKVWEEDALLLLEQLPDNSVDSIYVLNPDPWPKSRHHKRRIIRGETLQHFARILKADCPLLLTTDHADYADWMIGQMMAFEEDFRWLANRPRDWHAPPEGWHKTKYELKGEREGRRQYYLRFNLR